LRMSRYGITGQGRWSGPRLEADTAPRKKQNSYRLFKHLYSAFSAILLPALCVKKFRHRLSYVILKTKRPPDKVASLSE